MHSLKVAKLGYSTSIQGARPSSAAHNAVRLAGESPVFELTVYPRSYIRRWLGATRPAKART
jgi:hypothetical protein